MSAIGLVGLLMAWLSGPPQAAVPQAPKLTLAMTLRVQVGPPMELGEVPKGRRRIIPILGGTFEGPNIRGKVLAGGADWQIVRADGLAELFQERCDAILTPSAPGSAPLGLESTGDPSFCTLWTLAGMPALTLPLMNAANGMPIGVQLVGPRQGDARLLRTARWLARRVAP